MLELTIPQAGEKAKNIKDLIFTILTQEEDLSLIELTNIIKNQYVLNVTYQAVRKAVNTLEQQDILFKKGKKYSLNKEWVLKTKAFFDTLAVTHESGKKVKVFSQELAKENYAVYTLHNLLDLDNFWDEIILYLADHTKDKSYLSATNYAWWMILNLGRETKLFDNYHKKRIRSTVLLSKDNPLNQWAVRLYKEMRVSCKIKPQKNDPSIDLNVMGDTIIQVKYPPNIIKKIKKIFEEHTTVQDLDPKEITRLAHEPCEIKFIVFKNPSIAENLRKSYIESE